MTNKEKMIGILGGGQLGMMLATAAKNLGFKTNIYSPDYLSPALNYSTDQTIAEFDDKKNLTKFAESVDYITIEFENIPSDTINFIAKSNKLFPPSDAIKISQDRLKEKNFCRENKIATNRYINVLNTGDLSDWNYDKKSVMKTRQLGYDGKGQKIISSKREAEEAFNKFGQVPCIMEEFIDFKLEASTISVRDTYGNTYTYPPAENFHKNHILDTSNVPASINMKTENALKDISTKMITNLDYIGVLAVEFFVLKDNTILVNEIAPRVHNSGHWTLDGSEVSQFEQHIRAISQLKILTPKLIYKTKMLNLIGDDINIWKNKNNSNNEKIYIYGKADIKKGRKMGHVNFLEDLE
ncbi:MAG: 5-(carboxyamino)imidazole ribonucleotide synthase [Rhodobiaceae bacterium]|nr:5-(carboxyamino)imidazole ribonucleotide synthase [Rhodobiaceae bacterium]